MAPCNVYILTMKVVSKNPLPFASFLKSALKLVHLSAYYYRCNESIINYFSYIYSNNGKHQQHYKDRS